MKTTFTRDELRTLEISLQGELELALWKFLNMHFGPELQARGMSPGTLKHDIFRSNDKAALSALCHTVDVITAVLDSPALRPILAPCRADLKAGGELRGVGHV